MPKAPPKGVAEPPYQPKWKVSMEDGWVWATTALKELSKKLKEKKVETHRSQRPSTNDQKGS